MDTSTLNIFIGAVIALQAWQLREIVRLKTQVARLVARCPKCKEPVGED